MTSTESSLLGEQFRLLHHIQWGHNVGSPYIHIVPLPYFHFIHQHPYSIPKPSFPLALLSKKEGVVMSEASHWARHTPSGQFLDLQHHWNQQYFLLWTKDVLRFKSVWIKDDTWGSIVGNTHYQCVKPIQCALENMEQEMPSSGQ